MLFVVQASEKWLHFTHSKSHGWPVLIHRPQVLPLSPSQQSFLTREANKGQVLDLAPLGPSVPHVDQDRGHKGADDLDVSTSGESAKPSFLFSSLSSIFFALSDSEKTCGSKRTMYEEVPRLHTLDATLDALSVSWCPQYWPGAYVQIPGGSQGSLVSPQ